MIAVAGMNDENKILSLRELPLDQGKVNRNVFLEQITTVISKCLLFFYQCVCTPSLTWLQDEALVPMQLNSLRLIAHRRKIF